MLKHNQNGAANSILVSLIGAIVLLIAAIVFGGWAYSGRQDYKHNVDAKIAVAVTQAKSQQSATDAVSYAQQAKQPLTTWNGPEQYGSLVVQYPKTWSGYINSSNNGSSNENSSGALVDAYFNPGVVPNIGSTTFALHVSVVAGSYASTVQSLTSQQNNNGQPALTVNPYALPKLPSVVGVEVTGSIASGQSTATGTMVVLPLRSNTLEISTISSQYLSDFNNFVLPNLSFSP